MIKTNIRQYIGVAATAITSNNMSTMEVYCQEFLPFKTGVDGQAGTKPATVEVIDNETNAKISTPITMSDTIHCEYLGENTNLDIPDVHIGELVKVTNFGGDEKFYWSCLDRKDYIRHVEHWRMSVADQRKTNKTLTDDNTYYIDVDTRNHKRVLISTSDSDGEQFRYFIHIDALKSQVTIRDNDENIIRLESLIPRIYMENKVKTKVDLYNVDLLVNVPRDRITTIGRNDILTVGKNRTTTIKGDQLDTILGNDTLAVTKTRTETAKDKNIIIVNKYTRVSKEHLMTGQKYNAAAKEGQVVVNGLSLGTL